MITQEDLKELLNYNEETGLFTWIKDIGYKIKAGSVAGSKYSGYVHIKIAGRNFRAHRLVWLYTYGVWPENLLDHIDGNGFNNRLDNLRQATRTENNRNKSMYSNNKSGVKGVFWCNTRNAWRVRLRLDGTQVHLGFFDDIDEAKIVADRFREDNHKEFYRETGVDVALVLP